MKLRQIFQEAIWQSEDYGVSIAVIGNGNETDYRQYYTYMTSAWLQERGLILIGYTVKVGNEWQFRQA